MNELIEVRPEGLYCPAGDFHIDPWRPVARAVLTHGHSDHARAGSAQYWAAAPGLGVLRHRLDSGAPITPLNYDEVLQLGSARVSLHPAGHVLGSAQVRVEVDGRVWVVSGDYKRDADPTCAAFEPLCCDTFITEATFALPVYRWAPGAEVAQQIRHWWLDCATHGRTAVLLAYALGKVQRVLAELRALCDETVYLHGAMTPLVRVYREAGVAMLPTEPVSAQPRDFDWRGRLVLAPPSAAGTAWLRRFAPYSTGFASGWMRVRGNRRRRNHDRGFVLSDHADWPSLLRTIDETGARRVLVTHGHSEALLIALRERGIEASALRTQYEGEDDAEAAEADAADETP